MEVVAADSSRHEINPPSKQSSPEVLLMFDRREFLQSSLHGMAGIAASSSLLLNVGFSAEKETRDRPDTLFLTWRRDPTTTMVVQWIGPQQADDQVAVAYAPLDGEDWKTVAPQAHEYPMTDLRVYRTELTGLVPGSEYRFRIGEGKPEHRFRTMPAKATDSFQFVSGGDVGGNKHAVASNILAAKQDPMFALIGGDLGYDNGESVENSLIFMRNYSRHMIDGQGRLIPLVVCIGNHEVSGGYNRPRSDAPFYFALHDGLYHEQSYATLDFGDYLSLMLLDTGHIAPIRGEQTDWLDKALAERTERPHVIVANHVPAYPSVRQFDGKMGKEIRKHWSPLFEKHNVDIVLEHHDHAFKRTHPLTDGMAHKHGLIYLGDGSWGRLKSPESPEKRNYLAAVDEDYHITLHRIEGERRFHLALSDAGKIVDICTTSKRPRRPRAK